MTKIGDRVGAMLSADEKIVKFLGYGVYDGEEEIAGPLSAMFKQMGLPSSTPRLKLDDGQVVLGNQCWWGPEEQIRSKIEEYGKRGARLENVNIQTELARAEAEGEA